ncbi:MAG: hypothetical protein QM535_19565 [Limnohabitans sp.]|nr:hypothetical protein [Limnohabitans sp.]
METQAKKICHQPGCKIMEGGSCLESIDVTKDECPHFYLDSKNDEKNDEKINEQTKQYTSIKLFTGRELSFKETSIITNRYDSKLIAIVGESKSGKTTLLAEYYINLQKQPIKEYYFAGSKTQTGFEERCFYATVGSKAKKPDTGRTQSREFSFLHLALKHKDELDKEPTHFLISDISGETFREAKRSTVLMKDLTILKAADFILFIIDGEKIATKETRPVTLEDAKTFIQKALDENIFDSNTNLKVAVSKWDFLHSDTTFDFTDKIERVFKERFESKLGRLEFTKLAARSENASVETGFGLYDLLKGWKTEFTNEKASEISGGKQHSNRAFYKYSLPNT